MTPHHQEILIQIAQESIAHGLAKGSPLQVDLKTLPQELCETRATFVTLFIGENLRGCIGTLTAYQHVAQDVAEHAFAAAFRDPRFPPVIEEEKSKLKIKISILNPSEPIIFQSQEDLLNQLRPGLDGVILEFGQHRGTFLPSVWEDVPDKKEFLVHLKIKTGLTPDFWSDQIKVLRYTTETFGENENSV